VFLCDSDTLSEFIISFDGSGNDGSSDSDDECAAFCLISQHTLERTSLVIRDQLDASDRDLGKIQIPDVASVTSIQPSPNLSQLMYVLQKELCRQMTAWQSFICIPSISSEEHVCIKMC